MDNESRYMDNESRYMDNESRYIIQIISSKLNKITESEINKIMESEKLESGNPGEAEYAKESYDENLDKNVPLWLCSEYYKYFISTGLKYYPRGKIGTQLEEHG
jgi:hypothetical protein